MNDWRTKAQVSKRDGVKAAAIILGLMVVCVFIIWVLARLLRSETPPPQLRPPTPTVPTPAPTR